MAELFSMNLIIVWNISWLFKALLLVRLVILFHTFMILHQLKRSISSTLGRVLTIIYKSHIFDLSWVLGAPQRYIKGHVMIRNALRLWPNSHLLQWMWAPKMSQQLSGFPVFGSWFLMVFVGRFDLKTWKIVSCFSRNQNSWQWFQALCFFVSTLFGEDVPFYEHVLHMSGWKQATRRRLNTIVEETPWLGKDQMEVDCWLFDLLFMIFWTWLLWLWLLSSSSWWWCAICSWLFPIQRITWKCNSGQDVWIS